MVQTSPPRRKCNLVHTSTKLRLVSHIRLVIKYTCTPAGDGDCDAGGDGDSDGDGDGDMNIEIYGSS